VKVTIGKEKKELIESVLAIMSSIQLILILLPLMYMVTYATMRGTNKLKAMEKRSHQGNRSRSSRFIPSPTRQYSSSFVSHKDQHHFHRLEGTLG